VSSGSSGFWFCNWVVNKVRKVWKLSAIPVVAVEDVVVFDPGVVVPGAETTGAGMDASTDMAFS